MAVYIKEPSSSESTHHYVTLGKSGGMLISLSTDRGIIPFGPEIYGRVYKSFNVFQKTCALLGGKALRIVPVIIFTCPHLATGALEWDENSSVVECDADCVSLPSAYKHSINSTI